MIDQNKTEIHLAPNSGQWSARHDTALLGGPDEICLNGDVLAIACRNYVDDYTAQNAVIEQYRVHHRSGTAEVEWRGHFPFGGQIGVQQSCRYAANHVRITYDVKWPLRSRVQRHFGVGSLFLPGQWCRFYCLPPALHLAEGWGGQWQEIPAAPEQGERMIGHWHRPPLALVFERENGNRIEIGTGSDLWRWEGCLGQPPESGSYKLMLEKGGIRVVREPLMTCLGAVPPVQQHRFKWYLAWSGGGHPQRVREHGLTRLLADADRRLAPFAGEWPDSPRFLLDLADVQWPETVWKKPSISAFVKQAAGSEVCFESNAFQKLARTLVRQLKNRFSGGELLLRGLMPGPCWDAAHVGPSRAAGVVHWDMSSVLDFAVWTRQQLGADWQVGLDNELMRELPSLSGLFAPNGFERE